MAKNGEQNGKAPGIVIDKRVFKTAEEAKEAGRLPGCERWAIWCVAGPNTAPVYVWAGSRGQAVVRGAAELGIVARQAAKVPSKDDLTAALAAMSEEDRRALLAAYLPPAKAKGNK